MLKAEWRPYELRFIETAITSRAKMQTKKTYPVKVWDDETPAVAGYGECALFEGLSEEDTPEYENLLDAACRHPESLPEISSIRFGFETALADLRNGGQQLLADNDFTRGSLNIAINGLIWMGDKATMKRRIETKLAQGFRCVKLKIGGIDFNEEIELLRMIRREFTPDEIELRLDANGAFTLENAADRLDRLAEFSIHSIEQPIKQHQREAMAEICRHSPIPVALDEELIGFKSDGEKAAILDGIKPHYIILKPSLCGGFAEADRWIAMAEDRGIGWWATSALESNIGLNAIAQWVAGYKTTMPQGLGTGALYHNNFNSPLRQEKDYLRFEPTAKFEGLERIFKLF